MYKIIGYIVKDMAGQIITFAIKYPLAQNVADQHGIPHENIRLVYEFIAHPVYNTPVPDWKGGYYVDENTNLIIQDPENPDVTGTEIVPKEENLKPE